MECVLSTEVHRVEMGVVTVQGLIAGPGTPALLESGLLAGPFSRPPDPLFQTVTILSQTPAQLSGKQTNSPYSTLELDDPGVNHLTSQCPLTDVSSSSSLEPEHKAGPILISLTPWNLHRP